MQSGPPSPGGRRLRGVLHDSIFPMPPVGFGTMRNKEDSLPPDEGACSAAPISCCLICKLLPQRQTPYLHVQALGCSGERWRCCSQRPEGRA